MLDHDQMDAFRRDRILESWAEVATRTAHYLPGGVVLPIDRPGLYARVAQICGVSVELVRETVEAGRG